MQQFLKLILEFVFVTGNESVPIQLALCLFPWLAVSSDKILMYF